MATNHKYIRFTSGSIALDIIETDASNISLRNLRKNSSLIGSSFYGINGGWFDILPLQNTTPLNITVDNTTEGVMRSYQDTGAGAISFINNTLNYHWGIKNMNQIPSYNSATWIQGGYSMRLGNPNWYTACKNESYEPDYMMNNSYAARSAMVIRKSTKKVYLIVTQTRVNWSVFRQTIQQYFGIQDRTNGENTDYQGIFLDGSGSSQLKAKSGMTTVSSYNPLDNRALCGVIVLRNIN